MPGFNNSVVFADNVDFSGGSPVTGKVTTNGQLLIGSTAAPHIKVGSLASAGSTITITPGSGTINLETGSSIPSSFVTNSGTAISLSGVINILGSGAINTSGAGSTVTINSTGGGLAWSVITANQIAAINSGYICNKAGVLVLTMPSIAPVGSVIAAININTAADTQFLSANPGQLQVGNVLATANTGTVTSTALGDAIYFVCTTANTTWYAVSVVGNWTIS